MNQAIGAGLEAVNKQGTLIASGVEWVGVSGTGSRASVSLERAVSQSVVLKANGEQVRLTISVKADKIMALLEHADYGEYLRRQENTLILLRTLRFIYASKEIIITLLQPGAIPTLIKEIENDAGSIAASLAVQLVRGDLAEAKKYLTTYLTNKITQMAQQKVGND